MKRVIVMALGAMFSVSAVAGDYTSALSSCLADSTTGKDRKDLAAWIYVSMSQHPEMRRLAEIPAESQEEVFKTMGLLVTRLMSDNCASQTRDAFKHEGPTSSKIAWETLGALAMQELMSNADVQTAISGLNRYADLKKLGDALNER